jgi:ubiquinone/menaquinone biosynthesis C-methylase UbiE
MGRVSKRLIEKFDCNVIGCDISINMLKFATMHVNNPNKFVTCNKVTMKDLVDVIISAFVLQHVENPEAEINHLIDILTPGGYLILLDDPQSRFVPTIINPNDRYVNWHDDGYKISEKFDKHLVRFKEINYCDNYHKIIVYKKAA